MKVSELQGAELDYWVAKAINWDYGVNKYGALMEWRPSRDWEDGGPMIEEYIKGFRTGGTRSDEGVRYAIIDGPLGDLHIAGKNYLEAACRAVVASVYGDEVPKQEGET